MGGEITCSRGEKSPPPLHTYDLGEFERHFLLLKAGGQPAFKRPKPVYLNRRFNLPMLVNIVSFVKFDIFPTIPEHP